MKNKHIREASPRAKTSSIGSSIRLRFKHKYIEKELSL